MQRTIASFILAILTLFVSVHGAQAAARISISSDALSGQIGDEHGIAVSATLREGDYDGANPSKGEKAEFIIDSAREGDRCITNAAPSDDLGKVTGTCYASKPGSVSVSVKSLDRSDTSDKVTLQFTEDAAPTPEAGEPKKELSESEQQKLMQQYQAQQAGQAGQGAQTGQSTASTLANQPGLAEEKDSGMSDGLVQGSVRSASTVSDEPSVRSDLDLLNALIFLAGGVILIIGGLYFIWYQMKEHQARMQAKQYPQVPPSPTPPMSVAHTVPQVAPTPPAVDQPANVAPRTQTLNPVEVIARNAVLQAEKENKT
jgi:hypothetical protein